MATAEPVVRTPDRHQTLRSRRPFAWLKRVTNLKSSSSSPSPSKPPKTGRFPHRKHDPYPQSSHLHRPPPAASINGVSFCTPSQSVRDDASYLSYDGDHHDDHTAPLRSNQSAAPTLATNAETVASSSNQSKAGTAITNGGISSFDGDGGGRGSTFSSPNHSDRSLTTTLTTIQSTAASNLLQNNPNGTPNPGVNGANPNTNQATTSNHNSVNFNQPFPNSPIPASAIPPHLQHTLTASSRANDAVATDDASIMTLASSTKRRRRHSLDTNASVRALAPNSLYGGSRESLPLSVLSGLDASSLHSPHPRPSMSASLNNAANNNNNPSSSNAGGAGERASVYSTSGATAPVIASERNSYYAASAKAVRNSEVLGDGQSIRSGYGPSLLGRDRDRDRDATTGVASAATSIMGGVSGAGAGTGTSTAAGASGTTGTKPADAISMRGYLGDAASVRSMKSGHLGHGRQESLSGASLSFINSPLASPGFRECGAGELREGE